MGHVLTGGRSLLLPGRGRRAPSVFNHSPSRVAAPGLTGAPTFAVAEGQPLKGCCWKQDLETFFWFPVSVWGRARVCVVFLFF